MSLRAAFVSDIHLTALDDPRAVLFLKWLRSLRAGNLHESAFEQEGAITHLFLMGDIFDLWVADHKYFVDKFKDIVDELSRLRHEGVKIHYFEGNHDLDLEPFWENEMGFVIHDKPLLATLGPWRLRLEHGDQMDPEDKGYIFLRWFLRTGVMRFLGRHLPSFLVRRLGEWMSQKSRHYTSEIKTVSEMGAREKIRQHAELMAKQEFFDLLISGHLHVDDDYIWIKEYELGGEGRDQDISTHQNKKTNYRRREIRSINLGSWLTKPKALWLIGDKIEIQTL